MPRKARERSATGCYHIMGRGINHAAIYNDDADNMNFLHILDFCADEDFTIFAYCLMGNHFHLLAKADAGVLQHVMKAVGIRYVAYFNRRYQRDGPLFRGRYNSQPVTTKGYFLRVLRYIHRNPVAAGIVQEMQDYPWSSYLDYFGSRKKVLCQVDTSYALALHGLEWLRSYHQRPELNTRGMLEDSPLPAFTDTELRSFIRMTAGMECHEIPLYPETITTPLLRRLVEQEGAGISQLARLTGLARRHPPPIVIIVIKERNISYMYDLHATLKMEGGKMRLELVVECAYDDGNKQASMNLTTPPDQHDNIYTDARHYGDDEFDAVYDEDEEENLPF